MASDKEPGVRCPSCDSASVFKTDERYGVSTFFCTDCEHVWEVDAGRPRPQRPSGKLRLEPCTPDPPTPTLPALNDVVSCAAVLVQKTTAMQQRLKELQRRCDEVITASHRIRQWLRADKAWGPQHESSIVQ
jgi:hypothetical protein